MSSPKTYDFAPGAGIGQEGLTYYGGETRVYSHMIDNSRAAMEPALDQIWSLVTRARQAQTDYETLAVQIRSAPTLMQANLPAWGDETAASRVLNFFDVFGALVGGLRTTAINYREEEAAISGSFWDFQSSNSGYETSRFFSGFLMGGIQAGMNEQGFTGTEARVGVYRPGLQVAPQAGKVRLTAGEVVASPINNIAQNVKLAADASSKSNLAVVITKYKGPRGPVTELAIAGTQNLSPGVATPNPQDSQSMIVEMLGSDSVAYIALRDYINKQGADGVPIILAGHSQGGALVDKLKRDPKVKNTINIQAVTTFGAPILYSGAAEKADEAATLRVEREGDFVPKLQGASNPGDYDTLVLSDGTSPEEAAYYQANVAGKGGMDEIVGQHAMAAYVVTAARIARDNSARGVAAREPLTRWMQGATVVSQTTVNLSQTRYSPAELKQRADAKAKVEKDAAARREKSAGEILDGIAKNPI